MSNMYLQNIKKTTSAILVAMSRQGIFLIPAMYIGQIALGLEGVIIAQPISDMFAFLMSMPLCLKALKGMK
jgi:Na+-driven multidrug efflux pump